MCLCGCPLGLSAAFCGVMTISFLPQCMHKQTPIVPRSPLSRLLSGSPIQMQPFAGDVSRKCCPVIVSLCLPVARWLVACRLPACDSPELPTEGKEAWREERRGTIKMQNHHCGAVRRLAPTLFLQGSHLMME